MQCFYWESSVEELRQQTSIGDLGAANTLAGRLLDEGVNTGLVVTTIAQMISKPIHSARAPHRRVESDEDYIFMRSYA